MNHTIANLPAVQRDLYLSRVFRKHPEAKISTQKVEFEDMAVVFESTEAVSECCVEVKEGISLPSFTKRVESLLDCAANTSGEWVMKYSAKISQYNNDPREAIRLLCDRIASIDSDTGEVVGVMKIKRRSVKAGHAKIRIVPAEDSLQTVIRHNTAQGLKSLWKSLLWRLQPQYKGHEGMTQETTTIETIEPRIIVSPQFDEDDIQRAVELLSELGVEFDASKINVNLPLSPKYIKEIDSLNNIYVANFFASVILNKKIPAGMPKGMQVSKINGGVEIKISTPHYTNFKNKAQALSDWLDLGWKLPDI